VAYANTALGARTNKEGGPSALAAALTGKTPAYGLHLDGERAPTVEVRVEARLEGQGTASWGALGCSLGRATEGQVPLVSGAGRPDQAELKALGAAAITFGASPLVHIEGVTPEWAQHPRPKEVVSLTARDLEDAWDHLDDDGDAVDFVCLGCPHASLRELRRIADLLEGREVARTTWVCTARPTAEAARELGIVERIEGSGALVVCDTCFVVAPIEGQGRTLATDSAKGCYYARGHNRMGVHLGSVERCIEAAVSGRWR
jgi:predicted aconitase